MNDIKRVKIIKTGGDCWYGERFIGREFLVRDYRFNSNYWEMANWDPAQKRGDYWILKKHTVIINEFEIPEDLFRIE
jgi:hypothetical protein